MSKYVEVTFDSGQVYRLNTFYIVSDYIQSVLKIARENDDYLNTYEKLKNDDSLIKQHFMTLDFQLFEHVAIQVPGYYPRYKIESLKLIEE